MNIYSCFFCFALHTIFASLHVLMLPLCTLLSFLRACTCTACAFRSGYAAGRKTDRPSSAAGTASRQGPELWLWLLQRRYAGSVALVEIGGVGRAAGGSVEAMLW